MKFLATLYFKPPIACWSTTTLIRPNHLKQCHSLRLLRAHFYTILPQLVKRLRRKWLLQSTNNKLLTRKSSQMTGCLDIIPLVGTQMAEDIGNAFNVE